MTNGILALWNDCLPGHEEKYEAWYRDEHLPERLSIPGFVRGRRWRAEGHSPEYFTYYEVTDPSVLTSEAYLDRLNHPTPATKDVMSGSFQNMSRTICRVSGRAGHLYGSFAFSVLLEAPPKQPILDLLAAVPGVARVESWAAASTEYPPTREEQLRGGDNRIDACLLVETITNDATEPALDALTKIGLIAGRVTVYRFLCEMTD
ncbi:MAG: hypothetical protein AAGK00_08785 [Pseudomonadota bacterium]